LRAAGADVVVVVCHLGGLQTAAGPIVGAVADLARAIDGVDAIIGGHRHTEIQGHVAGIPIVVASSRGRALGRITLVWDGTSVIRSSAEVIHAFADSLDAAVPRISTYVDSVRQSVLPFVSRAIGTLSERLDEDMLARMVADAMRTAAGADVAVTNIGGIRSDLAAGPIRIGDLFEVVPFENTLVVATLTGRQLRDWLDTRPGAARVSGLSGRIDWLAPEGPRLTDLRTDAGPLANDRAYRVVTNNFLAHGGDGFEGFLVGTDVEWTPVLVRDALRSWIESHMSGNGTLHADLRARLLGTRPE